MNNDEVDFVVLWVDGSDVDWLKEKAKYDTSHKTTPENELARFRDWDNMRYWFRAIEKFSPWVHRIHFVTYGHVPSFLNLNNPKINIVRHEDIIPRKYLPTFNSAAIEVNINKIPGLAEKFVYFNDDTFLLRPVAKTDFFKHGLPCAEGLEEAITSIGDAAAFSHHLLNDIDVINKHFDKRTQYKKHLFKYFNIKYGVQNLRNLSLLLWNNYTGFKNSHLPTPFLKKTWYTVWSEERERLCQTSSHKFRTYYDLNQYVFRQWQIASGEFIPQLAQGKVYEISEENIQKIESEIFDQKHKLLCINDSDNLNDNDFEKLKSKINRAFNKILSEKSSFEV